MKCTHPNHVDGQSCIHYAISCNQDCLCCTGPCHHFEEDKNVCYDFGEPKGQCINCGFKDYEHTQLKETK